MSDGLRERKKQAAMRRIQVVALDLFDRDGFERVAVEEIAHEADVSPSSVYRYFGTKERIVLWDDFDFRFLEAVEAELAKHAPVDAVRRALAVTFAEFFGRDDDLAVRKVRYAVGEPALRAASLEVTDDFVGMVAETLARASGRDAGALEISVIASALVWSLIAALRHWHANDGQTSIEDEMEAALSVIGGGLRLDPVGRRSTTESSIA